MSSHQLLGHLTSTFSIIWPRWCYNFCLSAFQPLFTSKWTRRKGELGFYHSCLHNKGLQHHDSFLRLTLWRASFHLQVGQEKGNCSFQKNPTPCIIPQEQENIFHTIFAFFTKSGRKVLVRICLVAGVTWVVLTRKTPVFYLIFIIS